MSNVATKLYHYSLGFPRGFSANVGAVPLQYTKHALHEASTDKYQKINLPSLLQTGEARCIEAEMRGREVLKLVYRIPYSAQHDLILVCVPTRGSFIVKTVWLNLASDLHSTLKIENYGRPA